MKDEGKWYWHTRIVNRGWHGERLIGRTPPIPKTNSQFRRSRKRSSPFCGNCERQSCHCDGTSQKATLDVSVTQESWHHYSSVQNSIYRPRAKKPGGPWRATWQCRHWWHNSWHYRFFRGILYCYSSYHIPRSPSNDRFTTSCCSPISYNPPSLRHY